ncbi:nucleotidyltransferase domain-containing protein [Streptomyces sp. NPDC045470]|uniref:nucleotidyltransferase domain-containing protein n=1 Tax=unclassified Streptomyces TaxID=2593676 RepID=UPI0033FA884F
MDPALLDALPPSVQAALGRQGATPERIAALVDDRPGDVVMLAGSYATGEANPTSDLDILVLMPGPGARGVPGTTNHPSIFGDSFDGMAGELMVNIEYVSEDAIALVQQAVRPATGDAPPDLANLQGLELRLVQRVSTGLPLSNADRLEEIKKGIDADLVRASAAALAFVDTMSLLADTTVLSSPARELMCRGAAEALLTAGLNAFGRITYGTKHLLSRAAVAARLPGTPALFAQCDKVLFADRLPQEEALPWLLDLAEELFRAFGDERCAPGIQPLLEPFRPQWAWSGRAF